jgi:hypothetical protein
MTLLFGGSLPDESQRVKINHVYACDKCGLYWLGKELAKKEGVRVCYKCPNRPVKDITFTYEAQEWLYIAGLPALVKPWESKG